MDDEVRKQIFEDFKKMITTESVVGQPIYLGDATIVPFVDISFGFGTGSQGTNAVGGAGGGKVTPTAVLIMKGERVELFSIKNAGPNGTIDKVLNMVPEVISHFTKKKEKQEAVREAALKEAKQGHGRRSRDGGDRSEEQGVGSSTCHFTKRRNTTFGYRGIDRRKAAAIAAIPWEAPGNIKSVHVVCQRTTCTLFFSAFCFR